MPRRFPDRSIPQAELARFCRALERTGNMTLAAAAIGRPVRSLHRARRLHPTFAAQCTAALAVYAADGKRPLPGQPPRGRTRNDLLTEGGEWMVARCKDGRVQLRRARPGRLTEQALDSYLKTVAATGNLALAARSIGVSREAIQQRRRKDLPFDELVREALEMGFESLRQQLLETAVRSLDDRIGDAPGDWPTIGRMTAADAFAFYCKQQEYLERPPPFDPARRAAELALAANRLNRLMLRMRREAGEEVDEAEWNDLDARITAARPHPAAPRGRRRRE